MAEKFKLSFTRTKSWIACWSSLSRFLSILFLFGSLLVSTAGAQSLQPGYTENFSPRHYTPVHLIDSLQAVPDSTLPDPKSVMYKSLMVPGWGQVVNKQIWKVPIIYGLLGGLAGYSVWLTQRYHDYRAAYYNTEYNDMRFGPTPQYLQGINQDLLKTNRDTFRNRRDLIYVAIVAAYGLNVVDAYVFAHMRSFDVSEDLSMKTRVGPSVTSTGTPGITLKLELFNRTNQR